jgi:HK97 family phage major capsid protein
VAAFGKKDIPMTSIQMIENRNKLMTDATKLIQGADVTAEQRTSFDTMMVDVDALEADIARVERTEKFEAEQRTAARPPRGTPGASMDSAENLQIQKRALRDYMVSGVENRDLGVGTVTGSITGGSQLVAPAFYPILTQAQQAYGGLVNVVNQRTTDTGASMKISLSNDVANGLTTWPESSAASELDPSLATAQSATEMYNTGVITVTLEELQDSAWDLDAFISDVFGQRLYRGLAKYVSQGSSSGVFASYLAGGVSGATSAAGAAVGYADLLALWNSLDPAYEANALWTMNSNTRGQLMGVVDTMGRPLFIPSPNAGGFDTILGRKIVLDQYLPNVALSSKSIAFGDFKAGYTLRNVGQFQIARDPYTYLVSKGAVAFIGYGRGGSFSTNAGTNPLKYLTQRSS